MESTLARTKGARRCTNPECECVGRWVVGKMVLTKHGKLMCLRKGCHTIYQAREAIDPENDDHRLWVSDD